MKGKNGKYDCYIKRTTDNVQQILLQASRWRVKTANTILQIPWKKVKSYANTPTWRKIRCNHADISCLGGVFAKNTSLETKFPSTFGLGNFSSLDLYFPQMPLPNTIYFMIYLHDYTEYYLKHWLYQQYLLFVIFRT
jgi:hypothetical protein